MPTDNLADNAEVRKDAALELIDRGFHVLPVQRNEKRPDPLLAPNGFGDATQDHIKAADWFSVKPRANIGIACGAPFGLVVIDVDVKGQHNGIKTLADLGVDYLTLTADTPSGGYHLYFKHPGTTLPATLPGIDIKGANGGGYVLAPPSTLPNGAYTWRDQEIPIAEFPAQLLTKKAKAAPVSGPVATLVVPEGGRHSRLVELGAVYRGKGLAADEIETLLWEHASRYFDPPFSRENPKHVKEIEDVTRWYGGKEAPATEEAPAVVLTTAGLLQLADRPAEPNLLEPILPRAGNLMIYGASGVGKSHLALSIALALTTRGSFLDWLVPTAVPALFCDGEMPLEELKSRILGYLGGKPPPDNLFWQVARAQATDLPDLASISGQAHYLEAVASCGAKVVVFDNLTTLRLTTAEAPENSTEAWLPIAAFVRLLNNQGVATVWVHHASKAGQQRGSSAHTQVFDTVLAVRAVNEADPLAANDVEVVHEKHRRYHGEDALLFRAKAIEDVDGYVIWKRCGPDPLAEDVARLSKQGRSIREMAAALNRSKAGIEKALYRAKARGLLPLGGK